jgi:prephenate dehydrogenase
MKKISDITIIGAGFMGGSLVKALRRHLPEVTLRAYARSKRSLIRLRKTKIFSEVSQDFKTVVSPADIVVLAAPVEAIIESLRYIKPFLKKGAIVTDLGSSKVEICREAKKILPKEVDFIGAHPLTGSEKSGIAWSHEKLYERSLCLVTADEHDRAAKVISRLWRSVGAKVVFIDPHSHDKMLSAISHLPHLISFSLTDIIPASFAKHAPASLKDLTRISDSPGDIWADIFISNKDNITADINNFIKALKGFQLLLKKKDKIGIVRKIELINRKKRELL